MYSCRTVRLQRGDSEEKHAVIRDISGVDH